MKALKQSLLDKHRSVIKTESFPVPELDGDRLNALRNVIIQARLACDQPIPDKDSLGALIISWNAGLRRVHTSLLESSLQYAIETLQGANKITCSHVFQAYRELMRNRIETHNLLNAPATEPPPEYYELLAKLGFFPRDQEEKQPMTEKKRVRGKYAIEKMTQGERWGCTCGKQVIVLVKYGARKLCLDCALEQGILNSENHHG